MNSHPCSFGACSRAIPEFGARSGVLRRRLWNRSPREVRHPALRALRPGCEELAVTDPAQMPAREKRGARPKIATVERREASVPRYGTQGASLGAWRARQCACPTGASQAPVRLSALRHPEIPGARSDKAKPGRKKRAAGTKTAV